MAITTKQEGVWGIDQVYAKQNQGSIWSYTYQQYLWAWGKNEFGELGLNDIAKRSSAVQVPGSNWAQVASGSASVSAIKQDGTLWSWGKNVVGTFGIPSYADDAMLSSPVQVGTDKSWTLVRKEGNINEQNCCAVRNDKTLHSWGSNEYGQLGHNDRNNRDSPVKIPGTWSDGDYHLAVYGLNTLAIKPDGTMWIWGYNNQGKLGLNQSPTGYWWSPNRKDRSSPTQLTSSSDWKSCALGSSNGLALKTNGTLWSWGEATYGDHGHNDRISRSSPTQIGTDTDWDVVMSTGYSTYQTAAIKTNGTLWTWGENTQGQLGQNDVIHQSSPVQIPGTTWSHVMPAGYSCMAYKTDGTLWSWGYNNHGNLGHNDRITRSSPTQVVGDWDTLQFTKSATIRYGFLVITEEP